MRIALDSARVDIGESTILSGLTGTIAIPGVTALIGENGAGKTTLIHTLLGVRRVAEGTIDSRGVRMAYCPDAPAFDDFLSAKEVMKQSVRLAGLNSDEDAAVGILELVGLEPDSGKRVGEYSRGMKQRLGIAAALALRPDMLLLDEPMSALDPSGRAQILRLIGELGHSIGVLFSSHILNDIERVATDLMVLSGGSLAFSGPVGELVCKHAASATIEVSFEACGGPFSERFAVGGCDDGLIGPIATVTLEASVLPSVLRLAIDAPHEFRSVRVREPSLDEAYLRFVGGG